MDGPETSRPGLVEAYWRLHEMRGGDRASRLASDEFWWAWEVVDDTMTEGGEPALALLDDLLKWPAAEPCYVGAGPLEDLVHSFPDLADAVAVRCRLDPLWRAAAACIWTSNKAVHASLALYLPGPAAQS